MVLQRDMPIPFWGWADPGEKITVQLDDHARAPVADARGAWKIFLPALKADGKGHCVKIVGKNTIELEDILLGEVWLGSGQSNMEVPMTETDRAAEAIAAARHPRLRLFHPPHAKAPSPAKDVDAVWRPCTPETVASFSGVLYYFGRRLQEELDVPVGLINSSWGGSRIEWWTPSDPAGEMYNGMIAPLQPFAMRGVVWYQGEANVYYNKGMAYAGRMKSLIEGWRRAWGRDLPFYFVQVAPWNYSGYPPGPLPVLWEAQVASLKIPGTGMVVTTDLVDAAGLESGHPANKRDVGHRLALWALAKTYGRSDLVYSGPLYQNMAIEGKRIRLYFAHVAGGLNSRDGKPLSEFQIAGADGRFVPARADIDGNTVVVWAEGVDAPTQVRFGWHKLANPNLMNAAGLPASPFQTHDWQGGIGK